MHPRKPGTDLLHGSHERADLMKLETGSISRTFRIRQIASPWPIRNRAPWAKLLRDWLTISGAGLAITSVIAWVVLFQSLRLLLLAVNHDLARDATIANLAWSFVVGLQFDLAFTAYLLLPLLSLATLAGL